MMSDVKMKCWFSSEGC